MQSEARMAQYVEALERYPGGRLSCVEAARLLGVSERHFRRLSDPDAGGGLDRSAAGAGFGAAPMDGIEFVVEQYRTSYWEFTVGLVPPRSSNARPDIALMPPHTAPSVPRIASRSRLGHLARPKWIAGYQIRSY